MRKAEGRKRFGCSARQLESQTANKRQTYWVFPDALPTELRDLLRALLTMLGATGG